MRKWMKKYVYPEDISGAFVSLICLVLIPEIALSGFHLNCSLFLFPGSMDYNLHDTRTTLATFQGPEGYN